MDSPTLVTVQTREILALLSVAQVAFVLGGVWAIMRSSLKDIKDVIMRHEEFIRSHEIRLTRVETVCDIHHGHEHRITSEGSSEQ